MGLLTVVVVSCTPDLADHPPRTVPLEVAFHVSEQFYLAEDTVDGIAQLGASFELHNGDLLIADRLRPRVRRYTARGQLMNATGRFGEGPGEFRGIGGVMEDAASGRIAVVDGRLGRISVLSPDLQIDTILRPSPPSFGPVAPVPNGMAVSLGTGRGHGFFRIDWRGSQASGFYNPPSEIFSQPYWGSVARPLLATSTARIVVGTSLSYPMAVYGVDGDSLGTIGAPPPSFKPVPAVERGAFIGMDSEHRIRTWLEAFTVIARMDIIHDRYLVVTHAVLESDLARRFQPRHTSLDVYDMLDNRKLYEDILLPVDSYVLTGREYLYVVISEPPDPWTLVRLALATP